MTAPSGLSCHICQRYPAKTFTIRRHVGMIVVMRFYKTRMPLCRDHATSYCLSFLGQTLWQGWWGYISFFVNSLTILWDLGVLVAARLMPAPTASPAGLSPSLVPAQPAAPPATITPSSNADFFGKATG